MKQIFIVRTTLAYLAIIGMLVVLYGCAPTMVQFEVTAPAAYSETAPASIELGEFTSNKDASYGDILANMIAMGVTKQGFIKISESGAEAILNGELTVGESMDHHSTSYVDCSVQESYEKNGKVEYKDVTKTCTEHHVRTESETSVVYTLVDKRTGTTLVSDSAVSKYTETFSDVDASSARDKDEYGLFTIMQGSDTDSTSETPKNIIISNHLPSLADQIVAKISPHKLVVVRELQTVSVYENLEIGYEIGIGRKHVLNGRSDQAMTIWSKYTSNPNPNIRATVYYNMGVIRESEGKYKDAFELFSNASQAVPGEELYTKAMIMAKESLKQQQKLDRQLTRTTKPTSD